MKLRYPLTFLSLSMNMKMWMKLAVQIQKIAVQIRTRRLLRRKSVKSSLHKAFRAFSAHKSVYKLLPLSHDCKEDLFIPEKAKIRYLLIISCQQKNTELFRFKITLRKGVKE